MPLRNAQQLALDVCDAVRPGKSDAPRRFALRRVGRALLLPLVVASLVLSEWAAAADRPVAPPERPTGLWLTAGEGRSVTAAWTAVDGATSYQVRWRQGGNFQPSDQHTVTATTTTFTASAGGRWVVRVEACNDAGCGRGASAAIVAGVPAPPVGLSVTPAGGLNTASWNASAEATSYRARWRRRNASFQSDATTSTTATSVTFTVSESGEWIVRVQACNGNVCSKGTSATVTTVRAFLSVCDRTPEVRDALVARMGKSCNEITAADLGKIGYLDVSETDATALKTGDFDGLANLTTLILEDNALATLPADVFDGLANLEILSLSGNALTALPADVFDGLTSLTRLSLYDNALTALPADVFDGLANLTRLFLGGNALTTLPADVFDGLTSLALLALNGNALTALPADMFDGLANLTRLELGGNALTALPADVFDGLAKLANLNLEDNALTALPADVFDGLTSLTRLSLYDNALTALPADVFDGLANLTRLFLGGNDLTALPTDVFDGLASLRILELGGNPGAPFTVNLGPDVVVKQ